MANPVRVQNIAQSDLFDGQGWLFDEADFYEASEQAQDPKSRREAVINGLVGDIVDWIRSALEEVEGERWEAPWHGQTLLPHNPATGRTYSGMNVFLL